MLRRFVTFELYYILSLANVQLARLQLYKDDLRILHSTRNNSEKELNISNYFILKCVFLKLKKTSVNHASITFCDVHRKEVKNFSEVANVGF